MQVPVDMPTGSSINLPMAVLAGRWPLSLMRVSRQDCLVANFSNTFFDRRYLFGNIANYFELHVDGRNMDEDLFRFRPDAILILNIASYAAGTNPWQGVYDSLWCARSQADDDRFREQSCSDGYLELIGFQHFELARIRLGRRGHRIAQGTYSVDVLRAQSPSSVLFSRK
jgi:hypothetical protein